MNQLIFKHTSALIFIFKHTSALIFWLDLCSVEIEASLILFWGPGVGSRSLLGSVQRLEDTESTGQHDAIHLTETPLPTGHGLPQNAGRLLSGKIFCRWELLSSEDRQCEHGRQLGRSKGKG